MKTTNLLDVKMMTTLMMMVITMMLTVMKRMKQTNEMSFFFGLIGYLVSSHTGVGLLTKSPIFSFLSKWKFPQVRISSFLIPLFSLLFSSRAVWYVCLPLAVDNSNSLEEKTLRTPPSLRTWSQMTRCAASECWARFSTMTSLLEKPRSTVACPWERARSNLTTFQSSFKSAMLARRLK